MWAHIITMSKNVYVRVYGTAILLMGSCLLCILDKEPKAPLAIIPQLSVAAVGVIFILLGGCCIIGGSPMYVRIFEMRKRK